MSVDNFVRIYDNVMSKDICDVYINLFQKAKEASMVQDAGLTDTERKDSSFLLCDVNLDANNDFNLMLNDYVNQYNNDFSILNQYKMISYLNKMQETVDLKTKKNTKLRVEGRHDPCVVPRAPPVVDSIVSLVIADQALQGGFIKPVI